MGEKTRPSPRRRSRPARPSRRLSDQPSSEILAQLSVYAAHHPEFASAGGGRDRQRERHPRRQPRRGKSFHRHGPGLASADAEAIGYGHKVGIPCVIVNVMRVVARDRHAHDAGPGRPQPGALRVHGRLHQHRLLSVDRAECYEYAIHPSTAAEESRSPVNLLSDAFLGTQRSDRTWTP